MDRAFANGVIRLDTNPVGVYYSGQVISGSVIFDLDRPIKFSVLYIQFLGEANVLWTESEIQTVNGVQKHKLVKYVGREEYFNYTQQLAGGTGDTSHLAAGGQSFPFKYQIPFPAPSSFKGEQGEVSYSMTVHLIYADPSIPKEEIIKNFQVVAPFDLNKGNPKIKQPIDLEFEEIYGCGCFCAVDPVSIRLRLPVSGYCPGQVIPVAVEVTNESSIEITKMVFEILSRELYRSSYPASEYIPPEKVLVTTTRSPVLAHSKHEFTCDVAVPAIIPPYLENCGIIDVGYFFRVTMKLSGCNDKLQDEAEICLGLVPVREITVGEYVHPLADNLPTEPIPERDPAALTVPPVAVGFTGSNTSLQRVIPKPDPAALTVPPVAVGFTGSNTSLQRVIPKPDPAALTVPPVAVGFTGSNTSLQRVIPKPDPAALTVPPVAVGFTGSNTSLQRVQYNNAQIAPYPNPPQYPSGNLPYMTENKFQAPVSMEQRPAPHLQIGFKLEGMPAGVIYPSNVGQPPYHTGNMPQGNSGVPPYASFAPSAPPLTD